MSKILENPAVQAALAKASFWGEVAKEIAEDIIAAKKKWADMSALERKACVRHAVLQAETEEQLEQYLANLGVDSTADNYVTIDWGDGSPGDDMTEKEARMLFRALGGLVSKNDVLVLVTIDGVEY